MNNDQTPLVPLFALVKNFVGPEYRLLDRIHPLIFVSRKVYGDTDDIDNKKERELRGRRWDYKRMIYYDGEKVSEHG